MDIVFMADSFYFIEGRAYRCTAIVNSTKTRAVRVQFEEIKVQSYNGGQAIKIPKIDYTHVLEDVEPARE